MLEAVIRVIAGLISFLPASPFTSVLKTMDGFTALNFLNWFIPFNVFAGIVETWLVAIGAYYLYRIVKNKVDSL